MLRNDHIRFVAPFNAIFWDRGDIGADLPEIRESGEKRYIAQPSPFRLLSHWSASAKMKRFGFGKFMPKPKTEKDWVRIYNRHKYEVPTVKKLSLTLSAKGPGQTGARYVLHFTAYSCYMACVVHLSAI